MIARDLQNSQPRPMRAYPIVQTLARNFARIVADRCSSPSFGNETMRKILLSFGLTVAITLQIGTALAGSDVVIGRSVPADQRISLEQVNHGAWDVLLRKYCDANGLVDYQTWHDSREDRQRLEAYLAHLSAADPGRAATDAAKMAFWINAYNAVTIHGILREYPTSSIRNHTAKVFGYNIWDDLLLPVGDRTYSLNQMEHGVLRKMGDPRIHFAIVCASIGCPPLLNGAYLPQQLDDQLAANARRFFSDQAKFRYDLPRKTIEISPILNWFSEDFGADSAAQLRTISPFLPDAPAQTLAASGQASISYLDYDWGLNDQSTRRSTSQ